MIIPTDAMFQVLKSYISSKIYFETLKIIFKYHGSLPTEIIQRILSKNISQDSSGQRILSQ